MSETILKVENLSFFYENQEGISDFNFEIEKGDFVALIGKNGAGKTTLIHSILGILSPTNGRVLIAEQLTAKNISFSPQTEAIDWYLNVFDNVFLGALFENYKNPIEATKKALKQVGLEGKDAEDPTDLSGGQLQRVQLARQFVSNAELMILDEPTASLDVITTNSILNEISNRTRNGKSCLISSHDLDMLEKYCNKVLYIDGGKLKFFGSLEEFYKRYRQSNEFEVTINEELSDEWVRELQETFDVSSLQPIRVTLDDLNQTNELLRWFIKRNIIILSFSRIQNTLKDIIQLEG